MQASNETLAHEVEAIVARSGFSGRLKSVVIDPNDDPDMPFIRVNLDLRGIEKLPIRDGITLMEAIEDGLATLDERSASVRFAEAN